MEHLDYTVEWGESVESAISGMLNEQLTALDDNVDPPETPTGMMFCGCETCVLREVTYLAMLLGIKGYKEGNVDVVD